MPTCRSPRAIRFPRLTLGSTNYRGNGGYQQTCPLWIESTGWPSAFVARFATSGCGRGCVETR